jgi:hypothetical protein
MVSVHGGEGAAGATETASSGSLLRPWPTDSTRTPGGQLGRHVQGLLTVATSCAKGLPDVVGALDGPAAL